MRRTVARRSCLSAGWARRLHSLLADCTLQYAALRHVCRCSAGECTVRTRISRSLYALWPIDEQKRHEMFNHNPKDRLRLTWFQSAIYLDNSTSTSTIMPKSRAKVAMTSHVRENGTLRNCANLFVSFSSFTYGIHSREGGHHANEDRCKVKHPLFEDEEGTQSAVRD